MRSVTSTCRFVIIASLLLTPIIAMAQQDPKNDDSGWMMTYYKRPDPQSVSAHIRKLAEEGLFSKPNTQKLSAAFFARIFAANPGRANEWARVIDELPVEQQKSLWVAMHWSASEKCRAQLKLRADGDGEVAQFCSAIGNDEPPDFKSISDPAPGDLDACWASFFASGEPAYVESVVRCAIRPDVEGKMDLPKMAAQWSTRSLCQQDPRIREIVEAFRDQKATNDQRKLIDKLLTQDEPPATDEAPESDKR